MVKLNTDGSDLENPEKIRAGDILRDSEGKLIFAFTAPLGVGSNNQVEVQVDIIGITWCIQHGYSRVILEEDS